MGGSPVDFQSLLRAAKPSVQADSLDLEAALTKARLYARVAGEPAPRGVWLGPFEVLRCLGRGGMGSVFEARDQRHGAPLALKVLHGWTDDALERLRREFRRLSHISHANLVAMYELHVQHGLPFFTMALIEGQSLQERLQAEMPLDEAALRACLVQLLDALAAVHAHGLVHGDIKPSNVLLAADGKLTLLDFGVARALHEPHGSASSGTRRYLAPERLGQGAVDPAWDYYALGALLDECLERMAQPPSAAFTDVLRRLSRGLLEPDPRRRFGPDEVWSALDMGTPTAWGGEIAEDVFVGRAAELEALRGAFERARRELVVCAVRGEPGIGKTALVQRALRAAESEGALVLSGRCHQHEAVPYKGLDTILASLHAQLSGASQLDPATRETASWLRAASRLPSTGHAPPLTASGAQEAQALRLKAFAAVAALLAACAEHRRVILFIDDLQWGDDDAAALLEHLLGASRLPPLLVLSSVRDAEAGSCVAAVQAAMQRCASLDLHLGPLAGPDCRALAARVHAGELRDALVERLHGESCGNPLLLRALLRAPLEARDNQTARGFQGLVRARMDALDPHARELLALVTACGGPVSLRILRAALTRAEHVWLPLSTLRNAQLLRTIAEAGDTQVLPHHDRVRDAVLGLLAPELLRQHHLQLLRAAQAVAPDDPEFLAEHAFRAGSRDEAVRYAELAADRARSAMAFASARTLYARALEGHAPVRPRALVLKLADAAASLGDLDTSAPLYLEAAETHAQDTTASALRLRAAELYLLGGARERALALLQPALRRAGVPLPVSGAAVGWLALTSLCRAALALRGVRNAADAAPDARAEISFRVGYLLTVFEPARGIALVLWSTARGLRRGSAAQRGRGLAQLAHVFALLGWTSAARQDVMVDQALRLTRDDPTAHTHVLLAAALMRFSRTDYRAALACLDAAIPNLTVQAVDGLWFPSHVQAVVASVCVMTGDFVRIDTFAAAAEREASSYANHSAASQLRCACSWRALSLDDPDSMQRYTQGDRQRWAAARLTPLYGLAAWGEGHRLLYVGEHAAAAQLMAWEAPRFARSGVARAQPWTVALQYLWGCIALANSEQVQDHHARSAASFARRLERSSTVCGPGYAALLHAGLAVRRGELASALAHYATAGAVLTAAGMRGHAAAAAYRSAELQAQPNPAQAVTWFAEQGIAQPARWTRAYAP